MVLAYCQAHYNAARPHQGIAQHVLDSERGAHPATVTDIAEPNLNGLINEYRRAA